MSRIQDFIARLRNPLWLDDPQFFLDRTIPPLSGAEYDHILTEIQNHLSRQRTGRAANWLGLGIRFGGDSFLSSVRRRGLLRPSKYHFLSTTIDRATGILLEHASTLGLGDTALQYLRSVCTLAALSSAVREQQQSLLAFLRSNRPVALKGLLATTDFLFMRGHYADRTASTADIAFYSQEDIAEGLSLIFHLFSRTFGLTDRDLALLNAEAVAADRYFPPLIDACLIRKFQEWEILVDILGYVFAGQPGQAEITLCCPDVSLAKSLRLGYIQTDMRGHIRLEEIKDHSAISIRQVGEQFYKELGERFVEYVPDPLPRYRFIIPLAPKFLALFSRDKLFREELFALSASAKDNLASLEQILSFRLYEDLALSDLLRFQKFFGFFCAYATAHLTKVLPENRPIVFESLVPRLQLNELVDLLAQIMPRDKALKAVTFLSWSPDSARVFDIQYQPLLSLDGIITIPMNILVSSNIIRNSLQLARERIHSGDAHDPLSPEIAALLETAGWPTHIKLSYSFSDSHGELDVITYTGDALFIFECKNILHPCNVYEIRTSFDHIKRASEQLTRFLALWANPAFQRYLSALTGWSFSSELPAFTCIITGNRMFTGYRINRHPVRSVFELRGFVTEGTVQVADQVRRFWKSERITPDDLRSYLMDDILHKPQFDSMKRILHSYHLGDHTVHEEWYVLDMLEGVKNLGFDISKIPLPDINEQV